MSDVHAALEAIRAEFHLVKEEMAILKNAFEALQDVEDLEEEEGLEDESEEGEDDEEEAEDDEEACDAETNGPSIVAWQDMADTFAAMSEGVDFQGLLPVGKFGDLERWTSCLAVKKSHAKRFVNVAKMHHSSKKHLGKVKRKIKA